MEFKTSYVWLLKIWKKVFPKPSWGTYDPAMGEYCNPQNCSLEKLHEYSLKINDLDGEITYQWLLKHGKIGVAGSKKPTPSRPALTYSPLKNTGLVADLIKGKPMVNKTSNQVSGELLRWGGLTSCLGLAVMNFRISWYRKKRSQSTSLRPWMLVTIVSKLVYNLLAGLTTSLEVL